MRRKAVVAMSGGVDSSVAAALLKDDGYDVTGVMLKLWKGEDQNNDSGCCSLGAAEDARRVADVLDIPFYVFNFADRFEQTVIADFNATYAAGRTPNPCVRCNQWIKFDALLDRAKQLGADVLATGHYARVRRDGDRYRLLRGVDATKDQSYVLWMLTQGDLEHTRFPVGDMTKKETRAVAAELGLRTATKPDSQEICFVREGDVGGYLERTVPAAARPGPVLDRKGAVVGEHAGAARYTIGQRKGLGVSLGMPVFVTAIDVASNTVRVGTGDDLAVGALRLDDVSCLRDIADCERVLLQYRAHGSVHPSRLRSGDAGAVEVQLEDPVEAIAPGQSAALYSPADPDELLGGGVIAATTPARAVA